jgi:hypothetical protein
MRGIELKYIGIEKRDDQREGRPDDVDRCVTSAKADFF